MPIDPIAVKLFLDEQVDRYNRVGFIATDPISIPHRFYRKEDIEISGFLTATIAWGNRTTILKSASRMMEWMDEAPFDFVMNHSDLDLKRLEPFVHRTFNGTDLLAFVGALRHIYLTFGGLEGIFTQYQTDDSLQPAIHQLKQIFCSCPHLPRTCKHISDPEAGSAAKRINMFLRWMVRRDDRGVDFGLWRGISPSKLSCPLDLHSGRIARMLGILTRKQNDARAVAELDSVLRSFDADDPAKYDFALFGTGVFG